MSNLNKQLTWLLIAVAAFVLCGTPQMMQAQTAAPAPQPQTQTQRQQEPAQPNPGMIDPSKGPLQPVPSTAETPSDAGNQQSTEQPSAPSAPTPNTQPPQQQPLGAAVGQTGVTTGGPASKPAGSAIAPAKQRQTRSLLIKIGAIAAGAAALGTVFALSKGSPSNPPGAK